MTTQTFRPNIVASSEKQATYAGAIANQWASAFEQAASEYLAIPDDELALDGMTRADVAAKVAEAVARFERPIEAKSFIELNSMRVAIINAVFCELFGVPNSLDHMAPTYARNMGVM